MRTTAKGRNEARKLVANALSAVSLAAVGLGVVRPIFDSGVPFHVASALAALLVGFAFWGIAAYFLLTMEDE